MPETWTAEQLAERARCIAEVCPACARGEHVHVMRISAGEHTSDLIELHHRDSSEDGGCTLCPAAAIHFRAQGVPIDGKLSPCPPARSEVYAFKVLREALRPFARCGALLGRTPEMQAELDRLHLLVHQQDGSLLALQVTNGDLRGARLALADLDSRGHARSVEQILRPRGAPR